MRNPEERKLRALNLIRFIISEAIKNLVRFFIVHSFTVGCTSATHGYSKTNPIGLLYAHLIGSAAR